MACKKRSRPSSNDDPDTQAKRPHVHVHTEPEAAAITTPRLEREKRRLLYVWQQESDSFLCNKIKSQLESESLITNSGLIVSLAKLFKKSHWPGPASPNELEHCADCSETYDPRYNDDNLRNLCRVQHEVERASKDVGCSAWECERCGERWVREWGDTVDGGDTHDIGYCYEGPHNMDHSDSEPES